MTGHLTDYQWRVLCLIREGRALCCEMTEDGKRYFIEPGGPTVAWPTAEVMIGSGHVEAVGDGMFGTMQTYRGKGDRRC